MICAVKGPGAARRYRAALGGGPTACSLGARCAAFAGLPASGWRFFTGGGGAEPFALAVRGAAAQLAGRADPEELALLLEMLKVRELRMEQGAPPRGWQPARELAVFGLAPGGRLPQPPAPAGFCLETEPSLWEVADLLARGRELGEAGAQARDNFYAAACAMKNRGLACIWAARFESCLAATAGAYAMWGGQACLAAVETEEKLRHKGAGRWLVAGLANYLAQQGLGVSLLCAPGRERFYQALGLEKRGSAVCWRPKAP